MAEFDPRAGRDGVSQRYPASQGAGPQERGASGAGGAQGTSLGIRQSPRVLAQRKLITGWNASLPVQCYSKVGSKLVSASAQYVLDEDKRDTLHAAQGAAVPQPAQAFEKTGTTIFTGEALGREQDPQNFDSYKGKLQFNSAQSSVNPNDCGMYANALARGRDAWSKETLNGLRPGRREGLSTPEDRYKAAQGNEGLKALANRDRYDEGDEDNKEPYLNMQVGDVFELYFLDHVSKALKEGGECSHHAAAVVAVDGTDQITHEANAGLDITAGQFFMYGQALNQQFYSKNIGGFDWDKAPSIKDDADKKGILDRLIKTD